MLRPRVCLHTHTQSQASSVSALHFSSSHPLFPVCPLSPSHPRPRPLPPPPPPLPPRLLVSSGESRMAGRVRQGCSQAGRGRRRRGGGGDARSRKVTLHSLAVRAALLANYVLSLPSNHLPVALFSPRDGEEHTSDKDSGTTTTFAATADLDASDGSSISTTATPTPTTTHILRHVLSSHHLCTSDPQSPDSRELNLCSYSTCSPAPKQQHHDLRVKGESRSCREREQKSVCVFSTLWQTL